jgi:hypothetical protein
MKRVPELRDLSDDHHQGLVLARKAKKAAAQEPGFSATEVWADAEQRFISELEPHFKIEEMFLATALETQGETQLARRLYDEHKVLRDYFVPRASRTLDDLRSFGELLEKHIRFEERELFEVAQKVLSPDALHAVEAACHARPNEK